MSGTTTERFERAIRDICDDDEFVYCARTVAKTEENMDTALAFIEKAREVGDEITYEDIVALITVIRRRSDGE
ncbi:MAG: hypothetical protein Q4A07_10095 [Coriobacteriales bacterium]|nr:hypothetical protein [Coriobacteriales bacterium]